VITLNKLYVLRIFLNHSKVDLYDDSNDMKFQNSYNYKLINDSNGYCDEFEENAADETDNRKWTNRYAINSGTESGRDTGKENISSDPNGPVSTSSREATDHKKWIELGNGINFRN
jgi:hypothetical protein